MITVGDKVYLDTDKAYTGTVTRIRHSLVWVDGKITGYPMSRWVKI